MVFDLTGLQTTLRQNNARWEAVQNELSLLPEEQQRLRLGAEPPAGLLTLNARELRSTALLKLKFPFPPIHVRPAAWDWRNARGSNFVTPVRDQKTCGSCVAFGVCAAVECTWQVQANNPNLHPDLSEADLFYCQGGKVGRNCSNGWWPNEALTAFANPGIVDEACFPYTPGNQACHLCANSAQREVKITGFHSMTNAEDMKVWLSTRGALATCFTVYQDFFAYHTGTYHHVSGTAVGGHCVAVVGYDDNNKMWICKNSWGPAWGSGGFVNIGYGEVGIDAQMWAVEGVIPPHSRALLDSQVVTHRLELAPTP